MRENGLPFVEELASLPTLRRAWSEVAARRGVAGIDRVTIDEFGTGLDHRLHELGEEIRQRRYRPQPVRRVRPPFLAASDRALVVPTVRDRVVQRAVSDLLAPRIEPVLSPACRAFRKGFSARQAADDAGRWITENAPWVLRADVESFFDRIQPEILHEKLEPFIDSDGLRFLRPILRQRVFDRDQISEMVVGIPQGSPLSPLLGNLYLAAIDDTLHAEHPRYLRYCDDLLVVGESEDEVQRAHDRLAGALTPLGLALNEAKTRICRVEDGFTFLGYHFNVTGRGPAVKAVEALQSRLSELEGRGDLHGAKLGELDAIHRGWTAYFGEHPECWTGSPVGLLGLLRSRREVGDGDVPALSAARSRLAAGMTPSLALELARAWIAAGSPEHAWLELVTQLGEPGRRRPREVDIPTWAEVLEVEPTSLVRLLDRLPAPSEERLATLAEGAAELGRYQVGRRLAALDPERLKATAAAAPPRARWEESLDDRDLSLLLEWFAGREGAHAREEVTRSGHRRFVRVERPLEIEDWRAHLSGAVTLALPLVRAGNTCFLAVLDVDVERRALASNHGRPEGLLGRALGTALRLRQELTRRGCGSLLELSGFKGYHLWVRLAQPVAAGRLRRWLLDVAQAIGPLPEGVRVEEFPNRDRLRGDQTGPVVKLPLGIHGKTGRRCDLLNDRGEPLVEPIDALRTVSRVSASVILEATAAPAGTGRSEGQADQLPEIGPAARKILDGCRVLGDLERKARETFYLNHRERWTLLCTLGHLGDEGRSALHAIIANTYNYSAEVTARQIGRRPEFPMSCPKVRELHPESAALGACTCEFPSRGRCYPTPLLFALRPSQIPAFRRRRTDAAEKRRVPAAAQSGTLSAGSAAVTEDAFDADSILEKITELRRHRRGIDASLERLHRELLQKFESAGADTLPVRMGRLRRVRRGNGEGWELVIEL